MDADIKKQKQKWDGNLNVKELKEEKRKEEGIENKLISNML